VKLDFIAGIIAERKDSISMVEVQVNWIAGHQYEGIDSEGQTIRLGAAGETGVRPAEALLLALGSCAAYDVVTILAKQRAILQRMQVLVSSEQSERPPFKYHAIHLRFQIAAENLRLQRLERAVDLALNKYCTVRASLDPAIAVTFSVEVMGDG
jgi:putative redox protein